MKREIYIILILANLALSTLGFSADAIEPDCTSTVAPSALEPILESGAQVAKFLDRGAECYNKAVQLLATEDPENYKILQHIGKNIFSSWLDCRQPSYNLSIAVHENVHRLSGPLKGPNWYSYYLPAGRIFDVRRHFSEPLFNRSAIRKYLTEFQKGDSYFGAYFTRGIGEQDLFVLLDELNAYTQGLNNSYALRAHLDKSRASGERDGVAAMMMYTEYYLKLAREEHPALYREMRSKLQPILRVLWANAEASLKQAYAIPELGLDDKAYLKSVYSPELFAEIAPFLADPYRSSHTYFEPKELAAATFRREAAEKKEASVGTSILVSSYRTNSDGSFSAFTLELVKFSDGMRFGMNGRWYSVEEFQKSFPVGTEEGVLAKSMLAKF